VAAWPALNLCSLLRAPCGARTWCVVAGAAAGCLPACQPSHTCGIGLARLVGVVCWVPEPLVDPLWWCTGSVNSFVLVVVAQGLQLTQSRQLSCIQILCQRRSGDTVALAAPLLSSLLGVSCHHRGAVWRLRVLPPDGGLGACPILDCTRRPCAADIIKGIVLAACVASQPNQEVFPAPPLCGAQ
jgi:hypothetical protein